MRGPGRREIGHGALAERALVRMMPDAGEVPLHDPRRERDARVERLVVDGGGLRRDALAHGRGRADQGAGRGHRDGPHHGRRQRTRDPERHPRRRGPPRRHGLQGLRDGAAASPPSRWTSRSRGCRARSCSRRSTQAREGPPLHPRQDARRRSRTSRADLSKYAPRITTIKVKPDQIRLIIGPGGKTIKGIIDQTGVAIDVEDDGTVNIASADSDAVKQGPRHHQGPDGGARGRRRLQGHRPARRPTSARSSR